jgi:diaminopimelate epimerase
MQSSRWDANGNVYVVREAGAGGDLTGTDGALEVERVDGDEVWVAIVNPDGSRAEMSGNGTRIAGAWLLEQSGGERARVHVGDRKVDVRRVGDGLFESALGEVRVHPRERVAGLEVTSVSVGNPHAVVVGDPDDIRLVGPLLETHPRYPQRTNVQVVRVDAPGEVTARVWERGVGETASSGTSAVAVAAATHGDGEVVVHFPGGDLRVRLADGRASLIGHARRLA